jgi:hypothetical protein
VMKKLSPAPLGYPKVALPLILIAAVLIGFLFAYKLSSNNTANEITCQDYCIALRTDRADPEAITVPLGSLVQFSSEDGKSHSLSQGKGGEEHHHRGKFYSGEFKADEAWKVQFNDEGSFFFHDHFNPKINVLVVVYNPNKEYKVQ